MSSPTGFVLGLCFLGGILSLKRGLLAAANRLLDQKQPYLGEMWFATYG